MSWKWWLAGFAAMAVAFYVVSLFGLVGLVGVAALVLLGVGARAASRAVKGRRWLRSRWWILGGALLMLAWVGLLAWRWSVYLG